MVLLAVCFTSQLQAQTKTCTPAQIAACKKICNTTTVANCTPAQAAACQKVCSKSTTSKVASNENQSLDFIKLVSNTSEDKKTSCVKTCQPAKLTKNKKASCTAKKSKVAKTEQNKTAPIAQTVSLKSDSSEE